MTEIAQHTGLMEALTVGQVAETFGVTVRTLHHYDEVGLLRPSRRSAAGYRLYTGDDLVRLQHVVVYRRLGFSLEEVALLLDDPDADVAAHLREGDPPGRHSGFERDEERLRPAASGDLGEDGHDRRDAAELGHLAVPVLDASASRVREPVPAAAELLKG